MSPWLAWSREQLRHVPRSGISIDQVRGWRDLAATDDHEEDDDRLMLRWCGIFANCALGQSGRYPQTYSARAFSFERHPGFIELKEPRLGCLVLFYMLDKQRGSRHVAFYERDAGSDVIVLGGCQQGELKYPTLRSIAFPKAADWCGVTKYLWPAT